MGAKSSVHGTKSLTSVEGGKSTSGEGADVSPTKVDLATNQRISRQERRRNDGIHLKAKKNSK